MDPPETRYAKSGDVRIAYQVVGEGPLDLVFVPDIGGIAVNIAARVAAMAGPNETLVSSTVRDLVAGSGLRFADRGHHALKGLPEDVHLYSALSAG